MSWQLRHALITGLSGQDGALLAAQLLARGIAVSGTHRPGRALDDWRLRELGIARYRHLRSVALDPTAADACAAIVRDLQPDALFHLAGQSRVAESFREPQASIAANGGSTLNLLEALRRHAPRCRFVLASSAEIFGAPAQAPQDESTPLAARSPYGVSKLLAHSAVGAWRASYGLHASSAILFNHESALRDPAFVTRKISLAVAAIARGSAHEVVLGNLDARRDFGHAPDCVAAMAAMVERAQGDDYVLATGHAASIREFADAAFAAIGVALQWHGAGADEVGIDRASGAVRVRVDADLLRPFDAPLLVGNAAKARRELGFVSSRDLAGLARTMVEADLARLAPDRAPCA